MTFLKTFRRIALFLCLVLGASKLTAQPLTIAEWGQYVFAPPTNQSDWLAVAAGDSYSLALKVDGTVIGWGSHTYGQSTPPTNLTGVIAIAAGTSHSLALLANGTVIGWGWNDSGQATPPADLTSVIAIAAGAQHSLALKQDGTVVGWGNDGEIQPVVPPGLSNVIAIAAGEVQSVALRSDGTVRAWNYAGESTVPSNLTSVIAIAAYSSRCAAVRSDGSIVTWGGDFEGGIPPPANAPGAVAVGLSANQGVVLKSDGTIINWGFPSDILRAPSGLSGVVSISASGYHVVALTSAPPPPTGLSAHIVATNQVQLSWDDSQTGAKGFIVERSLETWLADSTSWTNVGTAGEGQTNFLDTVPDDTTNCFFRVRAFNDTGTSLNCEAIEVLIPPLMAPYNPYGYLGSDHQVIIGWYQFFYCASAFEVERAPDVEGSPGSWSRVSTAPFVFGQDYTIDTNIPAPGVYWYRIRGTNAVGDSPYTEPFSLGVLPPPTPFIENIFAFADRAIFWVDYSGEGMEIERAPDVNGSPGAWMQLTNILRDSPDFQDSGLAANTTYWYRFRAFNWVGYSDYTEPRSILVLPPAAPNVTMVIGATNGVDVGCNQLLYDQNGFHIEKAPNLDGVPGAWTSLATLNFSNTPFATFTDVAATPFQTYWYRARSFNALGESTNSTAVSITVLPPTAPADLLSSTFADRVRLQWTLLDIGTIGFKIESAPDLDGVAGTWTQIATIAASQHYPPATFTYTVTNQNADQPFFYRVRTFNWVGDSDPSDATTATVTLPATPHALTASIGDTNQVQLAWADDVADETGFIIEQAPDIEGAPGSWTQLATIDTPDHSYLFTQTNAMGNTTNWYRLRAYNGVGFSDYSDPLSLSIIAPANAPFLNGNAFKDTAILAWSLDYNGYISGYEVQRAPDADGVPGLWSTIAGVGPDNSYQDPGRIAETTYWYRIRAHNWLGQSPFSDPFYITILPPATPWNLGGSIGTTNQIFISWVDNSQDEDGFEVQKALDVDGAPGVWNTIAVIPATNQYSSFFTDTNVAPYTTNWYRVRAFNSIAVSDYSDSTFIPVTPPLAPQLFPAPFGISPGTKIEILPGNFADHSISVRLERALDDQGHPGQWAEFADFNPLPSFAVIDPGGEGKVYWYRARSYNWVGDSPYSDVLAINNGAPPQLYSLITTNNSVLITWSDRCIGYVFLPNLRTTNFVQAADTADGPFSNITPPIVMAGTTGSQVTTNYLDTGVLTNSPARFYRILRTP